jgi:hypothetical protein
VLALVAGLSAGNKAGLAVVAGVFILFALSAAILIPSRWPDFPTGAGLRPFLAATAALFVGMMLAVYFFAREPKEKAKEPTAAAVQPSAVAATGRAGPYHVRVPSTRTARSQ